MKPSYLRVLCLLALALFVHSAQAGLLQTEKPAATPSLSAATLVVFNTRDPVSSALAHYYAQKRSIPADQIVGLETSIEEEITRAEYEATIAEPLKRVLLQRGWWILETASSGVPRLIHNQIRFLALTRGIPLKIAHTATPPHGDRQEGPGFFTTTNEASVDSEIAALGSLSQSISGVLSNPYYRSFTPAIDFPNLPMMLVTRLDAPTSAQVRQMIDDSLLAETEGLRGFAYIDQRATKAEGLVLGEQWLENAAKFARRAGMPVVMEKTPELFPPDYPMRDAALYYGWYISDVSGPFATQQFQFRPGAVACHIHSFSAASVRDPLRGWAGPLLMHRASAVLGNVYEPFLPCTAELDVFQDRLSSGFTLAESAFSATRFVSWMPVVIGDPLYRPFALWQDVAASPKRDVWEAYRQVVKLWLENRPQGATLLQQASDEFKTGLFFEGVGLLQADSNETDSALRFFERAQKSYFNASDKIRCAIHAALLLERRAPPAVALKFLRQQIDAFPNTPATSVLRTIETRLRAKTQPQPTPKTNPARSRST